MLFSKFIHDFGSGTIPAGLDIGKSLANCRIDLISFRFRPPNLKEFLQRYVFIPRTQRILRELVKAIQF